ncbi:MAG: HAD-IB family phosphatase [Ignavibacteria bacterium]
MKNYKLKIFCDFDGTIAKNDVWISSFNGFINDIESFEKVCRDYHSEVLNGREAGKRHLSLVENFSFAKLDDYLRLEEIDEHFKDFAEFCRVNDHTLVVVSAGYEYYLDFILKRYNIDLKIFASELRQTDDKKLFSVFTHSDEYCTLCETCKRNILINNTNDLDNEISVFIGDGVSDQCVSGFADIVFAKGKLASYCWKNNITYFEYKNFSDIKMKLAKLTGNNMIRQRQEAKIRRRDVFMGG